MEYISPTNCGDVSKVQINASRKIFWGMEEVVIYYSTLVYKFSLIFLSQLRD